MFGHLRHSRERGNPEAKLKHWIRRVRGNDGGLSWRMTRAATLVISTKSGRQKT